MAIPRFLERLCETCCNVIKLSNVATKFSCGSISLSIGFAGIERRALTMPLAQILQQALVADPLAGPPARFALLATDDPTRAELAASITVQLSSLAPTLRSLSTLDRRVLQLTFPGRRFSSPAGWSTGESRR